MKPKIHLVTSRLPMECGSVSIPDRVEPATLNDIQRVAVDALQAELQRLRSAVLAVGEIIGSISEVQRETEFPYNVLNDIDLADLLQQVMNTQEEFDHRFALVLRPWLNQSRAAEDVAARVKAEMAGAS